MTLNKIHVGQSVRIVSVADSVAGRRLVEMGVYPGRTVSMLRSAPLRDPIEYMVGCCRLSLRSAEAALVLVEGL